MNSLRHYNYIEEKLSTLATRVELRGKLNILDLHLHCEDFYLRFFNALFGWNLENLNYRKQNTAGADLIDHKDKIVVQVSATATKNKVESALSKDLSAYSGYTFKFISISKDASALRSTTFINPHNLAFEPQSDVYDIASILKVILALDLEDQKRVASFIKAELGTEVDPVKLESNLATIINILAKVDWSRDTTSLETIPFDIDKKISYNNLHAARAIIDDYNVHHSRVDRIYSDFDKLGANKSTSVLDTIRRYYLTYMTKLSDDELFFKVVECATDRIQKSENYSAIPVDELELCVNILVVDSFMRCKIFKNPQGAGNAAS
jgi:hypothetical protein